MRETKERYTKKMVNTVLHEMELLYRAFSESRDGILYYQPQMEMMGRNLAHEHTGPDYDCAVCGFGPEFPIHYPKGGNFSINMIPAMIAVFEKVDDQNET